MDSLRELLVEIQYRDMATPELNKVDNKVDAVKDGFSKMGANVKTTEMATSKFGDTTKKTAKGLSKLGTKSKTATMEIKGLESKIKESSDATSRSIDRLNKQHKLWELSANKVAIVLRKNSKKSQVLKEKTKILSNEIKKLNPVLEETKRKYGDNSKEAQKLEDHILDLRVQHAEFNKELKNFKVNNVTSKINAIGDKMDQVGKTLTTRVTLPMVGVGAAAIKTTASFDDTMSQVRGITNASQEEFDQLRTKALQMGRDTKFSASEAGEAFTYMGMAGWNARQSLAGIEGVMALAAASGEDLAGVSDIVTDALSAFGMQAKDSTKFADLLASASSNSNTNVGMLGESFSYVAPLFGSLGYTAEDSALALGLMANAGVKGSKAGTALRGAITNLVKPTDSMATAMEKLGLKITDADGNMKPFKTVMDDMRSKFRGLSKEQQAQYASTIFGKEAMSGMLSIINASNEDYAKLTQATREYTGEAQRMADVNEDNIGGAFRSLKSALEGAAITVGDVLKPTVRDIAETVRDWTKKFTELSPATQETIVKIGALAAAIGPVLMVGKVFLKGISGAIKLGSNLFKMFGFLGGGIAKFAGFVKPLLGGLFTPWGLAIAGAIVAGVLIIKNLDKIKGAFKKVGEGIKSGIEKLKEWNKTKLQPKIATIKEKFQKSTNRYKEGRIGRNATGTNYWKGGLTELAERGPELVIGKQTRNLPQGYKVKTANETKKILNNTTSSNSNTVQSDTFAPTINIYPQTSNPKEIADIKKEVEKQLEPMLERYFYKLKKKRLSMS